MQVQCWKRGGFTQVGRLLGENNRRRWNKGIEVIYEKMTVMMDHINRVKRSDRLRISENIITSIDFRTL